MRIARIVIAALALLAGMPGAGIAWAQGEAAHRKVELVASAGDAPEPGSRAGGWLVARDAKGDGCIVLHLPPRRAGSAWGVEPGRVRVARRLLETPSAMAGTSAGERSRAELLFWTREGGGLTRVLVLPAEHGPLEESWSYGGGGRLDARATLRGVGVPMAATTIGATTYAVVRAGAGDEAEMWRLGTDEVWRSVALPAHGESGGAWSLHAERGALRAARVASGRVNVWEGDGEGAWTLTLSASAPEGWGGVGVVACAAGRALVRGVRDGHAALAWIGDEGVREVTIPESVPADARAVWLEDAGRVVLAWLASEGPGDAALARLRLCEVSAWTGEVMYEGGALAGGPIEAEDLASLVVLLVGTMALVLVFIVAPSAKGAVVMPAGYAMSPAWARAVAGAIDWMVAAGIASLIVGRSVVNPFTLAGGEGTVTALLVTLGAGFVVCGVMEGLLGASVGKLLTGCRVVSASSGTDARPGVGRSLARNAMRWGVPPLGLSWMVDVEGRSRVDRVAGTLVVSGIEPGDGTGASGERE
ncbi:MAG: RDD family protein [Phycisphaerales bacterium]|jgi:hypothetical protein|nr:RDD family protein [Phycisphaerales bacterium]